MKMCKVLKGKGNNLYKMLPYNHHRDFKVLMNRLQRLRLHRPSL